MDFNNFEDPCNILNKEISEIITNKYTIIETFECQLH